MSDPSPLIHNGCRGTPPDRREPFQGAAARPVPCAVSVVAGDKSVSMFLDPEKMPRLVSNLDRDNAVVTLSNLARAVHAAFGLGAIVDALDPAFDQIQAAMDKQGGARG